MIEHHNIDPLEYDQIVDGGLPLENILEPDLILRQMLENLPVKKWIFTNAGKNHALRVLNILCIKDQFQGLIYCDYSKKGFLCKPDPIIFVEAMKVVGVKSTNLCYLVDDSPSNIYAAKAQAWTTVHISKRPEDGVGHYNIKKIHDLPYVLPELWQYKR
jgi:pyrimidine and pyridine-specific 5'-nucleotidase